MLRATGGAEKAIWGLVRACIATGGYLRRVAEGVLDEVRPPQRAALPDAQLGLWVRDADGLPERPWRLRPGDRFDCISLGCKDLEVKVCVARQLDSEEQRTGDTWRGQAGEYPSCVTEKCPQGRGLREALGPGLAEACAAPSGGKRTRRERRSKDKKRQRAAARRQKVVGLLDPVRTLDLDNDPVPE